MIDHMKRIRDHFAESAQLKLEAAEVLAPDIARAAGILTECLFADGKNAQGKLSEVTDVHPEAVGFEAQMSAGLARQVYWPDEEEGFHWAVEAKTKKGWSRFTAHHYKPI